MMPEGVDDSSYAPPMLILHRPNDACSGGNRLGERRIRVVNDHYHPNAPAGKCLWTKILVLGRLICHPKFGSIGRQAGDYGSIRCINALHDVGTEGGLVELHCLRSASDRKHRRYRSTHHG